MSMFGTVPHELHRRRRAPMNPYFSKASVRKLEPVIRRSVAKLLKRLERNQRSGEAVPLVLAFKALTGDIITEYCFGKSFNHLDQEDYNQYHFDSVQNSFEMSHLMLQVGWLGWLMKPLSDAIPIKLFPGMRLLAEMRRVSALNYLIQ
jgi:cytochrome P450